MITAFQVLTYSSGGVYALITAHLANIIANWDHMEYGALRLLTFLIGEKIGTSIVRCAVQWKNYG